MDPPARCMQCWVAGQHHIRLEVDEAVTGASSKDIVRVQHDTFVGISCTEIVFGRRDSAAVSTQHKLPLIWPALLSPEGLALVR